MPLTVDPQLQRFIEDEAIPGTGISRDEFWNGLEALVLEMQDRNLALLSRRDELQSQIDAWHRANRNSTDAAQYAAFLERVGYLLPQPNEVEISPADLDEEISIVAGPQLVVPLSNARYVLNAANARWGSLYDALYGSDAVPHSGELIPKGNFNPARAAAVAAQGKGFLDRVAPLATGTHSQVVSYAVRDGDLWAVLRCRQATRIQNPERFVGYRGTASDPSRVLIRHHGLHCEIAIDRTDPVGALDAAGIKDIVLESALTSIMDLEDSVAAVDAADKVCLYRNWLGLMKGDLRATFDKNGTLIERKLSKDRDYIRADGGPMIVRGRSLMLVRNVGLHMFTDSVTVNGAEVPEGTIDCAVTSLIGIHDINGKRNNSRAGSIYIVKPKLHGPEEVAFTVELFVRVEEMLRLKPGTLKIGIMDEERRTSLNLKSCISAAASRIFFINTGFLDRTGDEIHTSMEAGPVVRKSDMKSTAWISAYENNNVDVGLACGMRGRAQIGKGMWAAPDNMADLVRLKIGHPMAGATTAWVPSPTAATLHSCHYHEISVEKRQVEIEDREPTDRFDLLQVPLLADSLEPNEIQHELDNNCQSILGYVVRWIDQGIGCSKVPDIHETNLMEDRATLRISSQHIANWLHHGIVSEMLVRDSLRRMAIVVDRQNASDPAYLPMSASYSTQAFKAAEDLVFRARLQPNGYTEFILHKHRRIAKQLAASVP